MITDEQIQNAYLRLYEKGILKKEVRSYEVSVWTLQDDFITVLKWSDVEQKGRIEHPKMILSNDNMYEFTFSIPMYYDIDGSGKLVENPLWYHTRNGNIMINMRKIKVIFNKDTADKFTLDFMITKVTEDHSGDVLTCEIKSEELAFHELGKIGYKYVLSLDEYYLDYISYETNGYWEKLDLTKVYSKPRQNVQYWCLKIGLEPYPGDNMPLDLGLWYYQIKMNWATFPLSTARLSNIVYEEAYACDWDDNLKVRRVESMREKERTVEVSESNVYNITQEIAKQFNIFCRYEYIYDDNYRIIGRLVTFFNNFIHDYDALSITYPYSSKRVSRELDSTDLTTKMYVRSMDDNTTLLGLANISYSSANKTKEDYILNFDYLYESGGINDDLKAWIENYEKEIRRLNNILIPLADTIAAYENLKIELEARITTYTNSIALDTELINANSALAQELVAKYDNSAIEGNYIDAYDRLHPAVATIIPDSDGNYYINLRSLKKGIKVLTLEIYRGYNSSTNQFIGEQIQGYSITYDEYGIPVAIYGIAPLNNSSRVYMAYSYEPHLYYDTIVKTWLEKLYNDTVALNKNKALLESEVAPLGIIKLLEEALDTYNSTMAEKNNLMMQLLEILGPALREGYWLPENYLDYGELYSKALLATSQYDSNFITTYTDNDCIFGWDDELFDEEQALYYANGVNQTPIPYPCINISSIYNYIKSLLDLFDNVYVMFYNGTNRSVNKATAFLNIKNIKTFAIGSEAVFSFVKVSNGTIYPALVVTGAKTLSDIELDRMRNNSGYISIGVLQVTPLNGTIYTTILDSQEITDNSYWNFNGENSWVQSNGTYILNSTFPNHCSAVYPRIKFSSLMLKTSSDTLFVKYNNELLTEYEDYYIRNRVFKYYNEILDADAYSSEYLVTIKPEVMARHALMTGNIEVDYTLSNASTAIYLDALEIAKENAYPKVSYTVEPNVLDESIMSTLYSKLNYLVMINDILLKFKDVFGYISKLDLDLDAPWNDVIEIKNYKNKFEDLFSSIVAQTELLQRNNSVLDSVARGTYLLSPNSLKTTLTNNNLEMIDYLASNFLTSDVMQDFLSGIFLEVSSVLSNANSAIGETVSLTTENSKILGDFAALILEELVPRTFRLTARPTEFKSGDIWIEVLWDSARSEEIEVARYIATSDSSNSRPGYGWIKTYGGSYALIQGAGIDIDAAKGNVVVEAPNELILHGGDVKINGDYAVNIGGVLVNIGSDSTHPNDYGGINLVATGYNSLNFEGVVASKVLINPTKISMFASEIEMKAGVATDNAIGVTAMTLSGSKGIWLGSNNGVRLFSGTATLDGKSASGANIELLPTHLLLGVSNGSSAGAIKVSPDSVVVATGSGTNSATNVESSGISGMSGGLTGVKLTRSTFSIAVMNSGTLNAMIMNQNGVTIGSGVTSNTSGASLGDATINASGGSYVRIKGNAITLNGTSMTLNASSSIALNGNNSSIAINGDGITMASGANLSVSTNNVIINSSATGTNSIFELKKANNSNGYDTALKYSITNGLEVHGKIYASELEIAGLSAASWLSANMATIGGWTIGSNYIGNANSKETSTVGMVNPSANTDGVFWAGGAYTGSPNFKVTKQGYVYINKLMVYDPDNVVSGTHTSDHYVPIDFSNVNFKLAVSGTASWNGSTFSVSVSLWGAFSRTLSYSTTVYLSENSTFTGETALGNTDVYKLSTDINATLAGGGLGKIATGTSYLNLHDFRIEARKSGYQAASNSVKNTANLDYIVVPSGDSDTANIFISIDLDTLNKTTGTRNFIAKANSVTKRTVTSSDYKIGWNDAASNCNTLGTVYKIIAHNGDWVKVEEVGTGYSHPGWKE